MQLATLVLGASAHDALLLVEGEPPIEGQIDWTELALVRDRGGSLHAEVIGAEADPVLAVEQAERKVARRLARLFATPGMQTIRDRLIYQSGAARIGGGLCLLVDLRKVTLRTLSWELIEALRPADSVLARTHILRRHHAPSARPPRSGCEELEVVLWLADPEDPIARADAEELAAGLDGTRGIRVFLSGGLDRPTRKREEVWRIVHVLGHLQRRLQNSLDTPTDIGLPDLVESLAVPGRTGPKNADALRDWLETADMVNLDARSPEFSGGDVPEGWGRALRATGVPIAVVPGEPWLVAPARAFTLACYRALARGWELPAAMHEGRTAVRARRDPRPPGRPRNARLWISGPDVIDIGAPLHPRARIAGWPRCAPALLPVIDEVLERARRSGFAGLEHLAYALAARYRGRELSYKSRDQLERMATVGLTLRLHAQVEDADPVVTPRLRRLAARLTPGFGLPDLLPVLLQELVALGYLSSESQDEVMEDFSDHDLTSPSVSTAQSALSPAEFQRLAGSGIPLFDTQVHGEVGAPRGLVFEVIGGPDDGRRLVLRKPDQILGRWDPDQPEDRSARLFVAPSPTTRQVSRRHLRYAGDCSVYIGKTVLYRRVGEEKPQLLRKSPDPLRLRPGEELVLNAAQRLRVIYAGQDREDLDDIDGGNPAIADPTGPPGPPLV